MGKVARSGSFSRREYSFSVALKQGRPTRFVLPIACEASVEDFAIPSSGRTNSKQDSSVSSTRAPTPSSAGQETNDNQDLPSPRNDTALYRIIHSQHAQEIPSSTMPPFRAAIPSTEPINR